LRWELLAYSLAKRVSCVTVDSPSNAMELPVNLRKIKSKL
jgi:hypothetical protein